MGGRRARTLSEIAGPGAAAQKSQVNRALEARDPDRLATSSARLLAEGSKTGDIVYLASKLVDFVTTNSARASALPYVERERLARQAWSRIKSAEGLPDDPIVTEALVSSVAKALGRGKS